MPTLSAVARFLVAVATLFVAGCLAVFGVPLTAGGLGVVGVLLLPGPRARARLLLAAGLLAIAPVGWWVPLHEYQDRVDALVAKVAGGGPEALSHRDLAGIWLLNLGMAGGGLLCGFPEAALETALLAVPGPEVRVFRSSFAMASPEVRAAVDQLATDPGGTRRVAFAYRRDLAHARVGLALNPLYLRAEPRGDGLEVRGRVAVSYPPRAFLVLLTARGRPIGIEEGLFHALQTRGWLHPYTAEWRWTVPRGGG